MNTLIHNIQDFFMADNIQSGRFLGVGGGGGGGCTVGPPGSLHAVMPPAYYHRELAGANKRKRRCLAVRR